MTPPKASRIPRLDADTDDAWSRDLAAARSGEDRTIQLPDAPTPEPPSAEDWGRLTRVLFRGESPRTTNHDH